MINFFKKKKPVCWDGTALKADMHSHLLPGIDDGAADMGAAVKLVEGLKEMGYTRLVTTPHIRWDQFRNTPDIIRYRQDLLQEELQKKNVDITLHAAAEYFLDEHVTGLLQKKEPLLTIHKNMVLVEFSLLHFSPYTKQILFDMLMAGYQPVIAHPERYTYLYRQYDLLHTCKDNGCLFQLNLYSIFGGYGKKVTEITAYLMAQDFYDFIGTDLHNVQQLERMKHLPQKPLLEKLINSDRLFNDRL